MKKLNHKPVLFLVILSACLHLSACNTFELSSQNLDWAGHKTDYLPPPIKMEYIETEQSVIDMNYTCFILAEKAAQAYNHHYRNQEGGVRYFFGENLFIGAIRCDSDNSGQYAFVTITASRSPDDATDVMTGPTVFAKTLDGAKTYEWSDWTKS